MAKEERPENVEKLLETRVWIYEKVYQERKAEN
jgi:hypothetical protein